MAKILITFDTIEEGFERLKEKHEVIFPPRGRDFTHEEILRNVEDVDVLCSVFDIPIDKEIMDRGDKLRLISNYAVGYNNIDIAHARTKGIAVTNTPYSVVEPTADLALALILSCTRRLAEWERKFRSEQHRIDRSRLAMLGCDLCGKTLGVIGFGNIGQAIARRCQAFGMKVIYNKNTALSTERERELAVRFASKEEIFAEADIVSLNCPLTADTHHLVSKRELEMMKPTAFLINTARGPIVDEAALVEALKAKKIAGAGLDVFEHNDTPSRTLFDLENVTLTPHIGTQTYDARLSMVHELVDNVLGFLHEDRPISRVC